MQGGFFQKSFLLIFISSILIAKIYSLEEIEKMPKSIARDYYIWRLLNETRITKEEAIKAYSLVYKKSYKIKKAIRKRLGYLPEKVEKRDSKNFIIYPEVAVKKSKKRVKKTL
jgi:hypothetical protein